MKPHVVELYYSVRELAFLLRFSETTVRTWLREGRFGPVDGEQENLGRILDISGDIRVPASRVNYFAARHSFDYSPGTKARNAAEMRRKLASKEAEHGA